MSTILDSSIQAALDEAVDSFNMASANKIPKRYHIPFLQGYDAFKRGFEINLCPYQNNMSEIYWKRGFNLAKEQSK